MEENEKSFKSVIVPKSHNHSFTKSVILPFMSGIIGASLVIGICFGIPQIQEAIFRKEETPSTQIMQQGNNSNMSGNINAQAISLSGYSETSMGVADKVLPSIVGIQIEYNVSSFFGLSAQTATGSGIIISEDRIHLNK